MKTESKFLLCGAAYMVLLALVVLAPHVTKPAAILCALVAFGAAAVCLGTLAYVEACNANR